MWKNRVNVGSQGFGRVKMMKNIENRTFAWWKMVENVELQSIKPKDEQKRYVPHISDLDAGFRLIIAFFMGLVTVMKHIVCIAGVLGEGKLGNYYLYPCVG